MEPARALRLATGSTVTLPADLERFLPPNAWQRLVAEPPRRGVLLNALDRLRSILYLMSTYLPAHLVQERMRRPAAGLVRGQMLSGSLLFSDVSGFTALSERLDSLEDGTEQLTELMNRYFERMLRVLSWSGGILLKFAGDALLAYFPEQEGGEQARWAMRAGQRMMGAIADFSTVATPGGTVDLRMKIGVSTGRFLAATVGNAERMEYVILGETVARTMAAEGIAHTDQIVADSRTAAYLDPARCVEQEEGFFAFVEDAIQDLDEYEIKAEARRARGAIPWSASPHAIITQMEIALRQIKALTPFLPPDLMQRIVGHAVQRQVESEHRPATVCFVNFTGLESLLAAWGKDGVQRTTRLLDDYFRTIHRVIARYGGIISRVDPYSQGSKVLVLFGAPVTHEEQPLRAVSAALSMNDELAALNDRWRKQLAPYLSRWGEGEKPSRSLPDGAADLDKPLIQQRIGIARGQTFAGQAGSLTRREYTVMGDDVNLAARLMAAAQPGQILVSQRVYDAVVDHYSATALVPIRVKGKSRPIPIYQPTGSRDDPLALRLRGRGRMVGRDVELEMGQAAIWRVLSGRGGILVIEGAAGAGKSRLADELAAYALARGVKVVFSACRSYAAYAAYAPWITLLRRLMGFSSPDNPFDDHSEGARLLRVLNDLGLTGTEYAEPLADLLGLPKSFPPSTSASPPSGHPEAHLADARTDPPQGTTLFARLEQKVAKQEEAKQDLWQLVQEHPLTQASRPAQAGQVWHSLQRRVAARQQERLFAAACGLLKRASAQAPLLLFFESAQWMDPASRALLDFLGEALRQMPVLVLVVQRSDAPAIPESGRKQTLTLGPLDQASTGALVGHLLGEEVQTDLVKAIYQLSGGNPLFVEEAVRWLQRTGRTTADGWSDGFQASTTLQELVLSHLDSLPSGQRDTVKSASIIGCEFLREEVRPLLLPVTGDEMLDNDLDRLEEKRLILLIESDPDARYAFRQTLVREVAYSSQSFAGRRELHARLAAYLEARHAGDLVQQAELLAHHHEQAELPLPAARYLLLSGNKARQRYAYPQAADFYRRALAILERLSATEAQKAAAESKALGARAHEGLGDIAALTGDFPAAVAGYDTARASLDEEAPARLLVKLAQVLPTQDRMSEAESYARQAWEVCEADTALQAAATLAWLLWRAGDAETDEWIKRGKALAVPSPAPWAGAVAALLADLTGDWNQSQRAYLGLGRPIGVALAACRQGDRHLQEGAIEGALELYGQAAATWESENDACGLALARYCQARAFVQGGDTISARSALREAQALLETAPTGNLSDRSATTQALAALEAGQTVPWSWQRWQCYDDTFRISILFQAWSW
jgi:class 3 adenylate cyclase/tetratricopeptide (TPR) repeat protein